MTRDASDDQTASDNRGGWVAAIIIAATFYIATAPTLTWLEFSSGMENLTVSTALEIRRTGKWLVPTLEGEARVAKPPLASWIAAASIRPKTFRHLDSPDPLVRLRAYRALAWQIRWPALVCACATLMAIFHLGRTIGGVWAGLIAMTVAGSSLYFLRYGKQATTDVQLALWVSVALAALARNCLVRTTWTASLVAGAALGLALMSKGPVALLQTLLPVAIFIGWRRPQLSAGAQHRGLRPLLLIVMIVVMLIVGGAWYAWVAANVPSVWQRWWIELTRANPGERTSNPLNYASIFLYMLPWTALFMHGLAWSMVEALRIARRRMEWDDHAGWMLALLLLIVPIIVMSFFPDRKERYLLPLLAPAAVLTTRGIMAMLDPADRRRVPPWVQWATILIIGVGLPVVAATKLMRINGQPWLPVNIAAVVVAMVAVLVGVASMASRRWPLAIVGASAVLMLLLQPVFFFGYRDTREGRSEMRPLAELVRREFPDARTYFWRPQGPRRVPADFSIYLNRTTSWVADPSAIPSAPTPQVYVSFQRMGIADPPPAPGWIYLDKVRRDRDWYYAFVRLPEDR